MIREKGIELAHYIYCNGLRKSNNNCFKYWQEFFYGIKTDNSLNTLNLQ